MTFRLALIAAARCCSRLAERFGDDRPLDSVGRLDVERAAPALVPLAKAELRYCSPSARSRETGRLLGYSPMAQPALRDCDMGRWRGCTLAEVMAREPRAVDAWLGDPRSAPHGGESLLAFIARVGRWLDTRPAENGGRILAVADPDVVRAVVAYVVKAPPSAFWNIDVLPLSVVMLACQTGKWRLRLENWIA